MDLFDAVDDSQAIFDAVAQQQRGGWIDALVARVPDARRAALAHEIEIRFDPEATDRALYLEESWLRGEGRDAAWMLARWCRDTLASTTRHSYRCEVNIGFDIVVRAFREEPWIPWAWIEILVAAPAHQRILAGQLAAIPFGPRAWPAIRHVLRGEVFAHRRLVAQRLAREGGVDGPLAIAWLQDPSLRSIAEDFLRTRVVEHEAWLRELLGTELSTGTRESTVRLLRRVDPRLSLDGRSEATVDAELQARLRATPADTEILRVWADLLATQGDPRGDHVALEVAVAESGPERAFELSRDVASHLREHRAAIWGKPGGVPYREKYRGRHVVAFQSDWSHRVRGSSVEALVERLQRFANHVTDQRGPTEVHVGRYLDDGPAIATIAMQPLPLERDLVNVLGDATALTHEHGRFVRRSRPEEPLAYERGLRDVCVAHPDITLHYVFRLTWPGTRVLLPHQEGEHYAAGEPLVGRLAIHLADRQFNLALRFPFESFEDDGFLVLYDAICKTLGRVMTPSRFLTLTPSADGRRIVHRRARFDRLP